MICSYHHSYGSCYRQSRFRGKFAHVFQQAEWSNFRCSLQPSLSTNALVHKNDAACMILASPSWWCLTPTHFNTFDWFDSWQLHTRLQVIFARSLGRSVGRLVSMEFMHDRAANAALVSPVTIWHRSLLRRGCSRIRRKWLSERLERNDDCNVQRQCASWSNF